MINLSKIWQKFSGFARSREARKNQPDIWFFYGFLLTFTLSVRKIIYFYPIKGNYNEYSAISLYLSDIFLILTILAWIVSILCNKYDNLSSISSAIHNLYNRKWWITCWEQLKCSTWNILKERLIIIPFLLVIWVFLSILWSDNKIIAVYRSIKFLEFFLLYIYIICKCSTWNILKNSFVIIILLGLFQSIIGIWQFIIQHSIGLIWLKESIISPDILGVAKVIFGSQKYIRAYGLFPHPNILGGFLLVSIILTLLYRKLFHMEHFIHCHFGYNPESKEILKQVQDDKDCSTWNIWIEKVAKNVPRGTIWWLILSIQIVALILTFSKSAILGLIIAFMYIFINQTKNVPRGTLENTRMFHVEHLKRYFIISLLIFGFLLFYFKIDLYSLFIKSLEERFIYLAISIKAIISHIFLGLGNGQFVLEMQKYASLSLEYWQFQPVHNVFLLILSELGIIGLFLFVWFLLEIFHPVKSRNVPPRKDLKCSTWNISNQCGRHGTFLSEWNNFEQEEQTKEEGEESILNNNYSTLSSSTALVYFKAILLGFIFIMLFDHYFWDIQQGQIMLWLIFGLIVVLNSNRKNPKI